MSDSFQPHRLMNARPPCLSLVPRACSNSTSIELVMPSNHFILCCPLLLLPSIFPSIRVFSKESILYIRWPKDWSFSFSISPSNQYSGLISFRIDWFYLLTVQGTLKSLLQHQKNQFSGAQFFSFGPALKSKHDSRSIININSMWSSRIWQELLLTF